MEPDFDIIIPVAVLVGFFLGVAFLIVAVTRAASRQAKSAMGLFAPPGFRARGLVLACNRVSSGVRLGGRRFVRRNMTLDVEIPGRAPFVATGAFLVPRGLVEALPGSSLELIVHPTDLRQIAVLGPGGFTGPWLNYGPPNPY